MLLITSITQKSALQNINQVIQPINAKIRMRVLLQMRVLLIQQQDCSSTGLMARCHIINTIPDLEAISSAPSPIYGFQYSTHHDQTFCPVH